MEKLFDLHKLDNTTTCSWIGGTSISENGMDWTIIAVIENGNIVHIALSNPNKVYLGISMRNINIENGPDYQKATCRIPEFETFISITIFGNNHPRYGGGHNTQIGKLEILHF